MGRIDVVECASLFMGRIDVVECASLFMGRIDVVSSGSDMHELWLSTEFT